MKKTNILAYLQLHFLYVSRKGNRYVFRDGDSIFVRKTNEIVVQVKGSCYEKDWANCVFLKEGQIFNLPLDAEFEAHRGPRGSTLGQLLPVPGEYVFFDRGLDNLGFRRIDNSTR